MKKKLIFLLFIVLLLQFYNSQAQISTDGSDQRIQSYIYVNGLSSIPPLHTDMPLDCMIGYIVMDSLSKAASIDDVMNKPLTTSLDSLRVASRYMYAVTDYSPNLMRRYMTTTRDSIPSDRYTSFPANSYYGMQIAIKKRLNEFGSNYGMLCMTHYILKVSIDTVINGIDTTYPNQAVPWTNISCTVLNKIKGQILPNNCRMDADRSINLDTLFLDENCLNFGYPTNWKTAIGFTDDRQVYTGDTIISLNKGEEYYVFLIQLSLWENADILVPVHQFESTGGLFEITDGYIEDPSNFWGLGLNPSEQEFLNKINELISNIKTWWIQ